MSEEINNLIEEKHKLQSQICLLEFEAKGYKEKLEKLDIKYKVFCKTPLGKHIKWQTTIGIPIKEFSLLMKENTLIIIGLSNSLKVDTHIFYVFDYTRLKGGTSGEDEYIDIKRVENKQEECSECKKNKSKIISLPTIEEYLDERKTK